MIIASRKKRSKKNWVAIVILMVAIPAIAAIIYFRGLERFTGTGFDFEAMEGKVPALAQQPRDTQVASLIPLHHWETAQGADVYFVPTEQLPILDIILTFDAGSSRDALKPGLSNLTAALLEEGSDQKTADDIADLFDEYGVRYSIEVDRDRTSIHLRTLTNEKQLKAATQLLAEIVSKPMFPAKSIERLKSQFKVQLAREKQLAEHVADEQFYQEIYGEHPYAHPIRGTAEGLETISYEDLKAFHQQYYVQKNAVVTLVGGLHRDKAKECAEIILAGLAEGLNPAPLPEVLALAASAEKRIPFNSEQAHVILGQPGRIAGDPDQYSLTVGNYILGGGGIIGRLFKEVREQRGLAYSVYSYFDHLKKPAPFMVALQTRREQTNEALDILKKTLDQFLTDGPTEQELESAKNYLIGSFPLGLNSNEKIANMVSDIAFYHLPFDHFDNYVNNIKNVSLDSIKDAFKRRINPERMALVVVGEEL